MAAPPGGGVPINGDPRLEAEADALGRAAARGGGREERDTQPRPGPTPAFAPAASPIQGKTSYPNFDEQRMHREGRDYLPVLAPAWPEPAVPTTEPEEQEPPGPSPAPRPRSSSDSGLAVPSRGGPAGGPRQARSLSLSDLGIAQQESGQSAPPLVSRDAVEAPASRQLMEAEPSDFDLMPGEPLSFRRSSSDLTSSASLELESPERGAAAQEPGPATRPPMLKRVRARMDVTAAKTKAKAIGRATSDALTEGTPGTTTSPAGATVGPATLLSPPASQGEMARETDLVRYHGMAKRHGIPAAATKVAGGASLGIGLGDVIAVGSDMRKLADTERRAELAGGLRSALHPIDREHSPKAAEARSEAKRLVTDTTLGTADLTAVQTPTAWTDVAKAAGQAAPSVLGPVATVAGAGVGTLVTARSLRRAGKSHKHKRELDELGKSERLSAAPELKEVAELQSKQMGKRRKRALAGAGGAALGAAGGVLLAASMATPVGWALAAGGAGVAAFLGGKKLHQRYKKRKAGTLGVERERHAETLVEAAHSDEIETRRAAHRVLRARGMDTRDVYGGDKKDAVELLKRKTKSW